MTSVVDGIIFSCFMLSIMIGSQLFTALLDTVRMKPASILSIAMYIGGFSLFVLAFVKVRAMFTWLSSSKSPTILFNGRILLLYFFRLIYLNCVVECTFPHCQQFDRPSFPNPVAPPS